jgi:hypothetical protein
MKKHLLILTFCSAILILSTNICFAQWESNLMLTNNPGSSATIMNNASCIAADGEFLHVVWTDNRNGDAATYYKRSVDQGKTWGTDTRLSDLGSTSANPAIAVSGSVIHVVWNDDRDGNLEIYYKRSTDGGLTWGADTRLTNDNDVSQHPSLSVSGSNVHVVWNDDRTLNGQIFYKHSSDAGVSWDSDTQLEADENYSKITSVASEGSDVHVVWYSTDKISGWDNLFYTHSTDYGLSWSSPEQLTDDLTCVYPSIAVSGSTVHLVWFDGRDGGGSTEIYYKQSSDGGSSWGPDTRLTNNTGYSSYPFVAASGTNVHLVWQDNPDSKINIYYRQSVDNGLNWDQELELSNATYAYYGSVAVSGSALNVVWTERSFGNDDILYKRNLAVNPVGIEEVAKSGEKLIVYPNPFLNEITASTNDNLPGEIIIYDISSRKVIQKEFANTITIDASQLPKGIYICEVRNSGGVLQKSKLVKN